MMLEWLKKSISWQTVDKAGVFILESSLFVHAHKLFTLRLPKHGLFIISISGQVTSLHP